MLIHPTDTTYKLLIERDLIRFAKARDYWVGDLASFASFWAERSQTSFEVTETEKSLNIQVNTPLAQIRPGLTLSLTGALTRTFQDSVLLVFAPASWPIPPAC